MNEFDKLLESGLLDEETKSALKEALDNRIKVKLTEEKDKLRDEFARRYEHDKKVMIEAADNMFTETVRKELTELHEEREQLIKSKVNYKKMTKEHAKAIQKFASSKLHEEIAELRADRKGLAEALQKFEQFAVKQITRELTEFHEDKRNLVETRTKLVREARGKIEESRRDFIKNASGLVESRLKKLVSNEIKSFREDIKEARKNNFGRRIFEAFMAEFMVSHSSDGTKLKEMVNAVKERDEKLQEALGKLEKQQKVLESTKTKVAVAENRLERHKKLNELLSPLPRNKKEVMAELLENVQTKRLDEAFKKHIKYVLNESSNKDRKSVLKEEFRKDVTGDRKPIIEHDSDNDDDLGRIKKLAGLL